MALPTTGPITLQMIATEFGGTAPHRLSEYYAGGAYVPQGAIGINGYVPSSGAISLAHFRGAAQAIYWQFTSANHTIYSGVHSCSLILDNNEIPAFGSWSTGTIVPGGPETDGVYDAKGTISIPTTFQDGNVYGLGMSLITTTNSKWVLAFVRNPFVSPVAASPFNTARLVGPGIDILYPASSFTFSLVTAWEVYASSPSNPIFSGGMTPGGTYTVYFT